MSKYIDAEKLIAEIEVARKNIEGVFSSGDCSFYDGNDDAYDRVLGIINSLQQEQPKKSQKNCDDCPHCVDRKDQFGWHFKGCFGGPYKGKFIAEIDECPLKQEQLEVDLEEEIKKYFQGLWPGMETAEQCNTQMQFTPPAIMRLVEHVFELGLKARKEE